MFERLEELVDQLLGNESIPPAVLEEQTVRLLAGLVMLLRQHRVNKRGRCHYCGWRRWTWRLGRGRPQCTVYLNFDFAMRQRLDVVWSRLLVDRKKQEFRFRHQKNLAAKAPMRF